jgi:hypothetical protein
MKIRGAQIMRRKMIALCAAVLALPAAFGIWKFTGWVQYEAAVSVRGLSEGILTTSSPVEIRKLNEKAKVVPLLDDVGPVIYRYALVIDGKPSRLICTFADPAVAMAKVKTLDADILRLMQKKWNLPELSDSSWRKYQQELTQYNGTGLPQDLGGMTYEEQRQQLMCFLDIYEDEGNNRDAVASINDANEALRQKRVSRIALDPVIDDLDSDSAASQEYWERIRQRSGNGK